MSYHDNYYASLRSKGMAVVNPLHEQRKRLTELEDFLKDIASKTDDAHLRERIGLILNNTEKK